MYDSDMDKIMKKYSGKKITRSKAIKIYCKEMCCAGDQKSWQNCTFTACPLRRFRLGREDQAKNEKIQGVSDKEG